MKSPVLLFVCCIAFIASSSAQQNRYRPRQKQEAERQTFAVGLAPFSLLFPSGKVNLRGEWAYRNNMSVNLLVGVPRPTTAPGFIADKVDLDERAEAPTNRYTSFGAVLEHRFYLGKNAPRGFYLAPYARYNNFAVKRITTNSENNYTTSVRGAVGGFGLGAAAGVQFRLGDFLTMDATIAGLDVKWLRGTLTYTTDDPDNDIAAFRDQVQEAVGDIPVIGSRLLAAIDDNSVKVRTPGFAVPGYRFNLTLNYVF
jgi:hypothetical protein